MKRYFPYIILIFLCSCINDNYFDFDKIIHFRTELSDEKRYSSLENQDTAGVNKKFYELFWEDLIDYENKSKLISDLGKFYSHKEVVQSNKYEKIRDLYSDRIRISFSISKCAPEYRDILIFQKDNQIVGISKICFQCNLNYTIDNDNQIRDLSMTDVEELKKILE